MAYKKSVYLKAKNILASRRDKAALEQSARHAEAAEKCPGLLEIEQEMATYGADCVKAIAMGEDAEKFIEELRVKSLEAQKKRADLLRAAGLPADWLEARYHCPLCRDTGFHDGYYCSCHKKLLADLAKKGLGVAGRYEQMTFDTFRTDYYPDERDEELDVNIREQMISVFEYCKAYAADFSSSSGNLCFFGKTGLGKTHLSIAIANVVTDKGYYVAYFGAGALMSRLEREHFGRGERDSELAEDVFDSDLLIIDDLGSEFSTSFTASELYRIVEERLSAGRATIISTNLSIDAVEDRYSQRIASRLIGAYTPVLFCGRDVRQLRN